MAIGSIGGSGGVDVAAGPRPGRAALPGRDVGVFSCPGDLRGLSQEVVTGGRRAWIPSVSVLIELIGPAIHNLDM